jgi:hypothetical protein
VCVEADRNALAFRDLLIHAKASPQPPGAESMPVEPAQPLPPSSFSL